MTGLPTQYGFFVSEQGTNTQVLYYSCSVHEIFTGMPPLIYLQHTPK